MPHPSSFLYVDLLFFIISSDALLTHLCTPFSPTLHRRASRRGGAVAPVSACGEGRRLKRHQPRFICRSELYVSLMFVPRLFLDSPSRLWPEISPEICLEIMLDDKERRSSSPSSSLKSGSWWLREGWGRGDYPIYPIYPRLPPFTPVMHRKDVREKMAQGSSSSIKWIENARNIIAHFARHRNSSPFYLQNFGWIFFFVFFFLSCELPRKPGLKELE